MPCTMEGIGSCCSACAPSACTPGTSGSRENKLDAAAAGISVLHDEDQTEREKGPTHEVNDADVNNP